ncbi:MAG: sigma-70 family RNA polymerase sigma factor [Proteobacteria bacterium]|nr:sigma-70 family RNA polymerase sigma factor [Pseudomonadota bacterium]
MADVPQATIRNDDRLDDSEMVLAVRDGDTTAFRGLVEKYQGRVYSMLYGMLRNREDARDVTQDAFVKAFHRLDSFRLESSFYTWLYRIAMNLAIDLVRKRKRRQTTSFEEDIATRDGDGEIAAAHSEDGPNKVLQRKRLYKRIMDAVETLPEDQKQAILLRELEGLSYKEISEIMGIPEGTVMSRLFYARKKLQKLLAGERD